MSIQRKSILITGASGGIGREIAIECAKQGARVGVHYHTNQQLAEETLSMLEGTEHSVFQADITNPAQVEHLINTAHSQLNGLDVLVNNAGICEKHHINEADYATWQAAWHRVMDTNLTAPSNLTFCAVQKMVAQGSGRIVNISSRGAFRGEPMMPWYGASKAGLNAMGQSLAQALGPDNVFIYTVAPGMVNSGMATDILNSEIGDDLRKQSSLGRVAEPQELGKIVSYLSLEAPDFMTGCIIDLNGASHLR